MTELKIRNIKHQSLFCNELMMRLDDSIQIIKSDEWEFSGVQNYTQIQQDIIRLRRELNQLRTMLDPYGKKVEK